MANQGDSRHNLGNNVWLETLLTRNAGTAYLRNYGSPRDAWMFRQHVPVTNYEELQDGWMDRVTSGEPDVLFSGRPCAYERTGGSSGGAKLIPYSTAGLLDFQSVIGRWLSHVVSNRGITGLVYLATSPATRPRTLVNGIPVGLPDGAYIGEAWGKWLAAHTAVAPELASEPSMAVWRQSTLQSLSNAQTLELISVWSPTFLLRLMDELPPPEALWPQLKLISCWTSGESAAPAAELQARLPHVQIQPKGLLSTECLVTVPDVQDRPVLSHCGFFEFENQGQLYLPEQLQSGLSYTVIATTASGLYRYETGDMVLCLGYAESGQPILEFQGRSGIACDLVGEKLTEVFVSKSLSDIPGFRFLTPLREPCAYAVITEPGTVVDLASIERLLNSNPQYAYARAMAQLAPLKHYAVTQLYERYVRAQIARGVRLADVKPVALMLDVTWIE